MLGNIISKILAGSAVGYITNYLAIQMLFREYLKYKKFSLGGVIVKEREEFESQISRLVESDVIHHQALEEELKKQNFEDVLQTIVGDLLKAHLPGVVEENFRIKDIPHVENSFQELKKALLTNLARPSQKIIQHLAENVSLQQAISGGQIEQVSGKITTILVDFLESDPVLLEVLENLLKDLKDQTVSQFISPEVVGHLTQNITGLFQEFHNSLKYSHALQIDEVIQKVQQATGLSELVEKLAAQISSRHLHEAFSKDNIDFLPQEILRQIQKIFQSDVSGDIIQTLLKFVFQVLKEEKSTVFELLSKELKESFETFLEEKLPGIMAMLIPWVRQKKVKLEVIIQEAFRENTSSFGQFLVTLIIGNVGRYVGIEEKIVDILEKQDPKELAQKTSDYVLRFLKENTIGEIVARFNEEKILTALSPVLQKNIQDSIQYIHADNLQNLFDKPIDTWFSKEQIAKALHNLLHTAIKVNLKEGWIFNEKSSHFLQKHIQKALLRFAETPLSAWLKEDKIPAYSKSLQTWLIDYLKSNAFFLEFMLSGAIQQYVSKKKWNDIINLKEDHTFEEKMVQVLDQFIQQQYDSFKEKNLKDYLSKLGDIEELDKQLARLLKNYLLEHLSGLMEGRIEALVKENLSNQPDTKLRGMVYKALGKELKPLSFFGAILGAITGAMLLILPEWNQIGAMLTVSGVAYGITGWGTNWLAIKMLFRPYSARKIPFIKWRLPFTPGVIAKNKGRFAQSMGRFIGDKLLNQENLKANFGKSQPKLEAAFKTLLAQKNYAFLNKLLENNREKFSRQISQSIYEYLVKQDSKLAEQIGTWLDKNKGWKLENIEMEGIKKGLNEYLNAEQIAPLVTPSLTEKVKEVARKDQSLKDILPPGLLRNIYRGIEQLIEKELKNLKGQLSFENILDIVDFKAVEHKVEEILQNNLKELINGKQEENIKDQIFKFLVSKIESKEIKGRIFEFIDDKLSSEFSPEKQIKDIFGGKLLQLLESNLTQILQRMIDLGLEWLQSNKDTIAEKVYQGAYEESSLAWTYKSSIKGTIDNLIEKGIPSFFKREFKSLQEMIHIQITELGESSLNTSNLVALDNESLKKKVDEILQNQKLLRKVRQLTNILLEERILKIPLNQLLKDDTRGLVSHLKKIVHPEGILIQRHLTKKLQEEGSLKQISEPISQLFLALLKRNILPVKLHTFLKGVEDKHFEVLSTQVVDFLLNSSAFENQKKNLVNKLLHTFRNQSLESLTDLDVLKRDVQKTLTHVLNDPENKFIILTSLRKFFEGSLGELNKGVENESKDFLVDTASQAIFEALQANIIPLINSLNFKAIVVREIENMHAKELEDLFYGFARKYFKYLIGYGFVFGILFGLAIDFGLLGVLWLLMG